MKDEQVKCEPDDMDCWAKREVKTEIYAVQNYRDFGCAGCVTTAAPLTPASIMMVALLLGALITRRARRPSG